MFILTSNHIFLFTVTTFFTGNHMSLFLPCCTRLSLAPWCRKSSVCCLRQQSRRFPPPLRSVDPGEYFSLSLSPFLFSQFYKEQYPFPIPFHFIVFIFWFFLRQQFLTSTINRYITKPGSWNFALVTIYTMYFLSLSSQPRAMTPEIYRIYCRMFTCSYFIRFPLS